MMPKLINYYRLQMNIFRNSFRILPKHTPLKPTPNPPFSFRPSFSPLLCFSTGKALHISTLNFSGINLKPFQYHNNNIQIQNISRNMQQILQTQSTLLQNHLDVIDKVYSNSNMMSVRFGSKICQSGKLMSLQEYDSVWRAYYWEHRPEKIVNESVEDIQASMLFDYYCYISVIKHVYNLEWLKTKYPQTGQYKLINNMYTIPNIKNYSSQPLQHFLTKMLNQPASKTLQKYKLAHSYFISNDLDVFMLQECGQVKWLEKEGEEDGKQGKFGAVKAGDSAILFKRDGVGEPDVDMIAKYGAMLNFNNDTCFYFSKLGYFQLSVHLSSKPQFYHQQTSTLLSTLSKILQQHPQLTLIMGIDANHFLPQLPPPLNRCPMTPQQYTTKKKRTSIQTQIRKSNISVQETKDFIVSNTKIQQYWIQKINGKNVRKEDMLPSEEHPYDHFVVRAKLEINK